MEQGHTTRHSGLDADLVDLAVTARAHAAAEVGTSETGHRHAGQCDDATGRQRAAVDREARQTVQLVEKVVLAACNGSDPGP